jgi:Trypsin-like peptidase domain
MKVTRAKLKRQLLRLTDPETARVVAIYNGSKKVIGAGCLLDDRYVLTCQHVVNYARKSSRKKTISVKIVGLLGGRLQEARIRKTGNASRNETDIALLELTKPLNLANAPVEFASPLQHGGKRYSVLGFPNYYEAGENATGHLQATDSTGMVQMDSGEGLKVIGGFSGAPVWSPDVKGYVGMVVAERAKEKVAWCIPSRLLCEFHPTLLVRFRMPPSDRPQINDYEADDPNLSIFGSLSDNGHRTLTAKVRKKYDEDEHENYFQVNAVYKLSPGSPAARGGYVTFITHPSFAGEDEDAYELFAKVDKKGEAKVEFYPNESFTMAAISDAGGNALTLDLSKVKGKPKDFE